MRDGPVGRRPAGRYGRVVTVLVLAVVTTLIAVGCATTARANGQANVAPRQAVGAETEKAARQPSVPAAAAPDGTAGQLSAGADGNPVSFSGNIENLPEGTTQEGAWQVGGRLVHVAPGTMIEGARGLLKRGEGLVVEGRQLPDGSVNASRLRVAKQHDDLDEETPEPTDDGATRQIKGKPQGTPEPPEGDDDDAGEGARKPTDTVHPVEFRGFIGTLPGSGMTGTWTVGSTTVTVDANTDFKLQLGAIATGAYVQVIGWQRADGTVVAAKILVKKYQPGQGTPGPKDLRASKAAATPAAGQGKQREVPGAVAPREKPGRGPHGDPPNGVGKGGNGGHK